MRGKIEIRLADGSAVEHLDVDLVLEFTESGFQQVIVSRMSNQNKEFILDLEAAACEIRDDCVSILGYGEAAGSAYQKFALSFFPGILH